MLDEPNVNESRRVIGKLKLVVVNHAFVVPALRHRWQLLAQDERFAVHLLVPRLWEQSWFGERVTYHIEEIHDGDFHLHPLPTTDTHNWSQYLFRSIDAHFRDIRPDLIYIVHEEGALIHQQIYLYRRLYAPKAKIVFFSMNARGVPHTHQPHPIKRAVQRFLWARTRKQTVAALAHYPGCKDSLRRGKYFKPIFLQTQVGVDEELFSPNPSARASYRRALRFDRATVIGYSGRLVEDKGVDDLVHAFVELAARRSDIALLLVGNGPLKPEIDALRAEHGLHERIHITGFVDQNEVPAYMNSMDVFVLGSKTMPHWIDTFPLVTVQAQSVGLPVIASNSASLPWQLDDTALLYPEGDRVQLASALTTLIDNPDLRAHYARKGQARSHEYFCHRGMTDSFKKVVDQVMEGTFMYHDDGEPYTQWKAY